MATILSETRSTSSSPYVYYTVAATTSNRTANSIDVKVTVTSRLASSESYLGSGDNYGIRGFIEIEDIEYELVLKKKAESWSGTTKHSVSKTITVDTLTASQTLLENIKFRAIRTSGNTANAGYLKATSCKDIEIPIGHTPPSDVNYTITELNQKLIEAGITDNLFVENLSKKQFDISAVLHDDADVSKYSIYNYFQVYSSQTTPIIIDFSVDDMFAGNSERDMVYIRARVDDTLGGSAWSENPSNTFDTYNYIPYSKVNLVETSTTAKRNGQTSGKVRLNINGNLYNGIVGNVDQSTFKPVVKYKFWQTGTEEPITYDYEIPSDNITIENGVFSVSNYEIGSIVETDVNWFNPENSYKVKIQLSDKFTTYESNEKTINVGEATWTEYKDRVDFKRITIKGVDVVAGSGGSSEGGTTNYNELTNKPSINGVTLSGSKSLNELGIQPKGNYLTSVPSEYITETELNEKGYITSSALDDYVTTNTEQDVTGAKTFKNVMKIQNGQGTGSLWIGGDVNANTLTNNKRHLARIVVPTFSDITKGATLLGFDSSGDSDLHVANKGSDVVSFGGSKKITNATSPMALAFCVAKTRGGMASTDKVYPLEMDSNQARFNVEPNYNGTKLATTNDLETKQDTLISGTNIKTINNQSLLGSGNITISSGSGGTSDYNSLENIPQINDVSLVGNKTLDELGIQPKGNYALSNDIPTKTSELTNDSGFITSIPTRNIVTANVGDSVISVSGSVTFALSKRVQIGTGLTINNNCITIGAGISVVLASANIRFENGGSSQNFNFYLIHRKPDDTYTIYGNARRQGVPANTTASASISSQLIEVEEGDTIEIALWKGSNTSTTVVANVTNLTVEAV